jgi:hypothetical protein
MATVNDRVQLIVGLPRSLVNRVSNLANETHHSVDDEICRLLERGLRDREAVKESISQARAEAGVRMPSTEQAWEQMQRIRDEVADELYPD